MSSNRPLQLVPLVLALLASASGAFAHDGLHEQIELVSRALDERPADARLYLKRSELLRLHRDFARSQADLDRARELGLAGLDLDLAQLDLYVARASAADDGTRTGAKVDLPAARKLAAEVIARHPRAAGPRLARARVFALLGEPLAAATEYGRGVALLAKPGPKHYHEHAGFLRAAGPQQRRAALLVLDAGIARLGSLVTLELEAIELELELRRFDAALARIDRIAVQSPRKERWLAQRGDVLHAAGRLEDALAAYESSLASIRALKRRHRNTRAVLELERRVTARKREVEAQLSAETIGR